MRRIALIKVVLILACFISISALLTACGVVQETWSIIKLLSMDQRVDASEETVTVRNCGVKETKTTDCSAGTQNDLSLNVGIGAAVVGGDVSAGLGIGRDSGESMDLESPPENSIYTYSLVKEYKTVAGLAVAKSQFGQEKNITYTFHASCTIKILSRSEETCAASQAEQPGPKNSLVQNFDDPANEGKLDTSVWGIYAVPSNITATAKQVDGHLSFEDKPPVIGGGMILYPLNWDSSRLQSIEARMMIPEGGAYEPIPAGKHQNGSINFTLTNGWTEFGILEGDSGLSLYASTYEKRIYDVPAKFGQWYAFRISYDRAQKKLHYFVDDKEVTSYTLDKTPPLGSGVQFWHDDNIPGAVLMDDIRIQNQ